MYRSQPHISQLKFDVTDFKKSLTMEKAPRKLTTDFMPKVILVELQDFNEGECS